MPQGFVETFLDDGYGDMYDIMRALREVRTDGAIISDHLWSMVGGRVRGRGAGGWLYARISPGGETRSMVARVVFSD